MTFPRKTVVHESVWEGDGLHSGEPVRVRLLTGEDGIWFRYGSERIQARAENVTETRRCTRLGPISTIEHLMSALAGLGVTDAEIELSAPELPALDGASACYVSSIRAGGQAEIGESSISGPFARVFDRTESAKVAISTGTGHWRYEFDTGTRWPGLQEFETQLSPDLYAMEIAPARTFAFESELEQIQAAGLGKGLNAETALVLGEAGYVNSAKFPDEPARHKLLDLVGDLYLSGVPPTLLNVVAERSGHEANVRMAAKLASHVKIE